MPPPAFLPPPLHATSALPRAASLSHAPAAAPRARRPPRRAAAAACAAPAGGRGGARTPLAPLIGADGSVGGEAGVGVFGVYDEARALQYVGISRDVATSLRRALARRPAEAWWFAAEYVARPSRVVLEGARDAWVAEAGEAGVPGCDGGEEQARWEGGVDVRGPWVALEAGERAEIEGAEPADMPKVLRAVCARVQAGIVGELEARGLVERLRFAPKLKAQGLLDVESAKVKVPDRIGSSTALPKGADP